MTSSRFAPLLLAASFLTTLPALAQNSGQGRAIITVLSKHSEVAPTVTQQDVSAKVNGKDASITAWAPFKGADDSLELVVLIDANARNIGRQLDEMKSFLQSLGPHTRAAVGYMQNGTVAMAGPLSADHSRLVNELHLPAGPGTNPYFSLSQLAQNWPSQDRNARREVLMLSGGVDPEGRRFDPDDPYVASAIRDSVRAGLVVYSIYWRSGPDGGDGSSSLTTEGGQSHLAQLTDATGGYSYWNGTGNPISFQPYFEDMNKRFASQYALVFTGRADRKPSNETLKLKVEGLGVQVTAPSQVLVTPAAQ
jgi:hypothetical protein